MRGRGGPVVHGLLPNGDDEEDLWGPEVSVRVLRVEADDVSASGSPPSLLYYRVPAWALLSRGPEGQEEPVYEGTLQQTRPWRLRKTARKEVEEFAEQLFTDPAEWS